MTLNTFFEKFALFADAPDAVEKMRELILLLALDGKIGETNATTWPRIQLGDLGEWGSGGTPLSSESRYYDGNIPWLIIGDLNDGVVTSSMKTITEEGLVNSSARMLPKGVLLIAMYGSIGKLGITDIECATNQAIAFCKPDPKKADLRYLFHAFMGLRPKFLSRGQGLAQKNISQRILRAWEIGLPPLAEQKRIVAKVDELMALCDRLEVQQQEREQQHTALSRASLARFADAPTPANLQLLFHKSYTIPPADLRKSILTLAVQGKLVPQDPNDVAVEVPAVPRVTKSKGEREAPFDLPGNWKWMQLGQVSELINGDRSKNYPNKAEYVPEGVAWINTGHIEPDGTLSTEWMHFITRKKFDSLRSGKVRPGDLVYCLRGATLGKTAIITQYEEGAVASSLVIIRLSPVVEPRYAYRFLTSPLGREQIFQFDNGSAQPNLSANNVKKYWVPIPPHAEQRRIVAKVDQLMAMVDALETRLSASHTTAKNLLDALVAELTSGSQKAS
jgi:type I restriction enzyme S subunit